MTKIIQNMTLDVVESDQCLSVAAKRYDQDSRFLDIQLTSEGTTLNVESDATVTINARRPDGASRSFFCEVTDRGTVLAPLTYWMLEYDGVVMCDITVVDTDMRKLTSMLFALEVMCAASCDDDFMEPDAESSEDVYLHLLRRLGAKGDDLVIDTAENRLYLISDGMKCGQGVPLRVSVSGEEGPQGEKGDTGEQGPQGVPGTNGTDGQDGYTPVKGIDYYTAEEKAEIVEEITANIIDPLEAMIDESGVLDE